MEEKKLKRNDNETDAKEFTSPIADNKWCRRVSNVVLIDKLMTPDDLTNTVVIMAGGKGKRLRPITNTCLKLMLPLNGKPILKF